MSRDGRWLTVRAARGAETRTVVTTRTATEPAAAMPGGTGRRPPTPLLVLLGMVIAPAALSGWLGRGAPASGPGDASPLTLAAASQPEGAASVFAEVDGVRLHALSERTLFLGFHEAAYDQALALEPVGRLARNDNEDRFDPVADRAGPAYTVLNGRGRSNAATSAADVVVPEGTPVFAPVDGEVVDVRPYRLYGRYDDSRVEIVVDGADDLRVVLIHVSDVEVAVGDRVTAGETVVARSATPFPFESQVDRYYDGPPRPHVHLEVKRGEGVAGE